MPSRFTRDALDRLIAALTELREHCLQHEQANGSHVDRAAPAYRASVRNLLHYLAFRQHDLRDMQRELTSLGLSSLGRTEAHTLAGIDAVLAALHRLAARDMPRPPAALPPVDFASGPAALVEHADALLGPEPPDRTVRIMVTMPSEAATDPRLVKDLVARGMDVMRVNCAHDDAKAWAAMIANLRQAEADIGRTCKVLMDLGGPKLRTGPIGGGSRIVRWSPRRNVHGQVVEPVRLWLARSGRPVPPSDIPLVVLPVDGALLRRARADDYLGFRDTRGRSRRLRILGRTRDGCWAEARTGAYLTSGTSLRLTRAGTEVARGVVGELPMVEEPIRLRPGDQLRVTANGPGRRAKRVAAGSLCQPASIPCTLPEVFGQVKPGERIFFDDGKIQGRICEASPESLLVDITHARPRGSKLRAEKGINLPDSALNIPSLTAKDLDDMVFVARHADVVGLSFAQTADDVLQLEAALAERSGGDIGILLKIESRTAFEQLPHLLLAGLQSPPVGVMVARGDLAVEIGFDRLAEVQEQILWLCEAAHVPVIWATQVLETLAKTGNPSRAEVTDAAMAARAECVMLNKGPHTPAAVSFLDNVLRRMRQHQTKKRAMLRRLSVASPEAVPLVAPISAPSQSVVTQETRRLAGRRPRLAPEGRT